MLCLLSGCAYARFGGRRHHGGAGPDPHHRRRATGVLRAVAARLPGRALFGAGRLRHRARGQDAGRHLCGASAAAVTGSARLGLGAAVATDVDFSRWCTVSPRSPIAATRSTSVSPSISSLPAPHHSRPGLVPAGRARGRSPKTRASRRSFCPARSGAPRAGARAGLFRADLGPLAAGLCRVPMVPFTWLVLFRTRFGLRLRSVGENPAAVGATGISVTCLRYRAASSPAFWRARPARTCHSPRMPAS